MKKKLFTIAGAIAAFAAMLSMTACSLTGTSTTTSGEESGSSSWNWIIMIGIYALVIGGAYFLLFRPQSKKKKKEAALRRNAQIGDQITTIGGITGRIVAVKEDTDTVVLETGTDRNKILVKRWAISSVDSADQGSAPAEKEQPKKLFGFGKKAQKDEAPAEKTEEKKD